MTIEVFVPSAGPKYRPSRNRSSSGAGLSFDVRSGSHQMASPKVAAGDADLRPMSRSYPVLPSRPTMYLRNIAMAYGTIQVMAG